MCSEEQQDDSERGQQQQTTTTTKMVVGVGVATSNSVSMKSFMIGWKAKQMTIYHKWRGQSVSWVMVVQKHKMTVLSEEFPTTIATTVVGRGGGRWQQQSINELFYNGLEVDKAVKEQSTIV